MEEQDSITATITGLTHADQPVAVPTSSSTAVTAETSPTDA
jgi:hypothetical protein